VDRLTRSERLFTALWPTPSVRAAIARWQDAWTWPPQAARVKADRLHVTLHFLGDVPAPSVPELARALRVPFEPFELELGTAEIWPNGVAVLQPHTTPPALRQLHAALGARIAVLALPLDARPYRAHVTLARRAHAATPPLLGPGLLWPVDDGYVLVRSLPGGAGYEVIERF
jgi:RNA 2',3'-cyclic 3'-phosphodiesterase